MFSPKSFIVLALYLGLWSSQVNFYIWYKGVVQFHIFACKYPIVSKPYVKKTILSILNCLGWKPCWKLIDFECMGLFLTSNSIPLIYRSIFMAVLYAWYSYNFNLLNTNEANDIKLIPFILMHVNTLKIFLCISFIFYILVMFMQLKVLSYHMYLR